MLLQDQLFSKAKNNCKQLDLEKVVNMNKNAPNASFTDNIKWGLESGKSIEKVKDLKLARRFELIKRTWYLKNSCRKINSRAIFDSIY